MTVLLCLSIFCPVMTAAGAVLILCKVLPVNLLALVIVLNVILMLAPCTMFTMSRMINDPPQDVESGAASTATRPQNPPQNSNPPRNSSSIPVLEGGGAATTTSIEVSTLQRQSQSRSRSCACATIKRRAIKAALAAKDAMLVSSLYKVSRDDDLELDGLDCPVCLESLLLLAPSEEDAAAQQKARPATSRETVARCSVCLQAVHGKCISACIFTDIEAGRRPRCPMCIQHLC